MHHESTASITFDGPDTRQIDDAAFLRDFDVMSAFGATAAGGVDRQAGSAADTAHRAWFSRLISGHGLTVDYDRIGNQYGLLELNPGAPFVLVGSHLDSQPTAGRFDGAYGVLVAAYAAFRLAAAWRASGHTPRYNIAVVNWFNEEGSRFKPSMMGSAVYTGKLPLESALAMTDHAGVTVADVLTESGFRRDADGPTAACAAEIHIEQGRVLENQGVVLGLVEATWAAHKYQVAVRGEQSHSGATAMADRRDALAAAARVVIAAYELARDSDGVVHSSVGQLDVYPNSPVVVASRVDLLLDFRSRDMAAIEAASVRIAEAFTRIEAEHGVVIDSELSHAWDVNPYQPEGVALAESVTRELGIEDARVMTVAGHDSVNMKDLVPTVMLFVPSVEGISHNEGELTHPTDMVAGLAVFTEVVSRLADGALDDA